MAKFIVRRIVDAYACYEAEVEADTPAEAAVKAMGNEESYQWGEADIETFDARSFVTLDDEGNGIEDTYIGEI